MPLIVGAYPTYVASPDLVAPVVSRLAETSLFCGLEVHYGDELVVPATPGDWRHVVTLIPGTMTRMAKDARFGLASPDAEGRKAALQWLAEVRDAIVAAGNIRAVELHSAPREVASAEAFADSLTQAAGWDWNGATLVVEHCDVWQTELPVSKGFLSATDEIDIISGLANASTPVTFGLNWGRSVIESHDVATPVEQVRAARDRGVLGAVMFSSVTDRDSDWGPAWEDRHYPPQEVTGTPDVSMLTRDEIRATLAAAGDVEADGGFVGFKVGFSPATLTADERADRLIETAKLIESVQRA